MYQPVDFAKIAKAIEATEKILCQESHLKEKAQLMLREAERNWKQALSISGCRVGN
ncbi:hypothetical protein [Bacillus sp. B-jedd]|uniref:hypothetical protein n=1 Tax=Bacillus sp. B-jedd TaxID=1476857 RepID=UPI0005155964|nr:hypothetical protein [Bacillus sp. B-jedd]CEG27601.1 hypothetical protein BN1002_02469 [Bacillus sp. B-jedd]